MFGNNRNQLRQIFFDCWQLKQSGQPADTMQQTILHIIDLHPQYHALLNNKNSLEKDFPVENGETNPFLHMSMHIALHEQLSTNRPSGINTIYRTLCHQYGSAHDAEHQMMECLGESIWQAQRNHTLPDENAYIHCLTKLIRNI